MNPTSKSLTLHPNFNSPCKIIYVNSMTAYLLAYYCSVRFSFSTRDFMDKVGKVGNPALDLINFFKNLPYTEFVIFGAVFPTFPTFPFRIYPLYISTFPTSSYPKNNNNIIIIIINNNKHSLLMKSEYI